ncbi:MAG: 16S rRNA (cytosine(1402)-N(4))-methyltransferase [Micavibrio aeruginosavorus]|uniref:Ribosomal RNA small subunit methyltransferase H n=1 Tax=Micavibrio aeruginosavorus TaxID=349221 RepID=A0A2W5N4A2_9BACT|nr:MAG: 16S rRNA (cytosine(1402)-N(4))-methyltransferase [Micavibrio aeruginosavorus]
MTSPHFPVMLPEVLSVLSPKDGEVYVDGTFGAGGYTRAFLESANCTVIAIDRDPAAVSRADALKAEFGDRLIFVPGKFGDALELVKATGYAQVDGFVLDVGVSSMQFDEANRGFSFRFDAPLDMRMDTSSGETAADLVNSMDEEDLANLIYKYGDERKSRYIARKIVEERAIAPIETTLRLADMIRDVVFKSPKDKIDPATRTFQALRIAVNDELGELERGLHAAEQLLKDGGRLIVVSFHSLEEGIVKSFLYERAGKTPNASKYLPLAAKSADPSFTLSPKKPVDPSATEISQNPRSRSARLRAALRTSSPVWSKAGGRA